jgi:large subunit ribosomal protein L4
VVLLKEYSLDGKEKEKIDIEDKLLDVPLKEELIKNYILAIRYNKRQFSANTKGKGEVKTTGKKPHAQKGLGRARQGSLASPQYRGGGIVHGPKPKDVRMKRNKKERRAAIKALIVDRIKANRVYVLDQPLKEIKTKTIFEFLKKLKLEKKRVLILMTKEDGFQNVQRSVRNIEKKHFSLLENVNGYDLALCLDILLVGKAKEEIINILKR